MKIGEPCYAVVEEDNSISESEGLYIFDQPDEANIVVRDDPLGRRAMSVTLIPTSEVARLRACEAALKPFAELNDLINPRLDHVETQIPNKDIEAASTALASPAGGEAKKEK